MACWWFFHDWGKWGEPFQQRRCKECGKEQERQIGWWDMSKDCECEQEDKP